MNRKTLSGLPQWLRDLLERMDQEMTLRGFTRGTRRVYLAHVRRFYLARTSPEPEAVSREEQVKTHGGRPDPVAGNSPHDAGQRDSLSGRGAYRYSSTNGSLLDGTQGAKKSGPATGGLTSSRLQLPSLPTSSWERGPFPAMTYPLAFRAV